MAKSKKQIRPPAEIAKVYNPQFERALKEYERTKEKRAETPPKRYRGAKAAFLAILMAFGIGIGDAIAQSAGHSQQMYTLVDVDSNDEKPTIMAANGATHIMDENSLALVRGTLQEGMNWTFAYDENGNIVEGNVSSEYLEEILQISEDDLEKYNVVYQISSDIGANVRETGTTEANIVSTLGYQDYVLGSTTSTTEYDNEWVEILGTSDGGVITGYIREDLLQEVTIISDKDENIPQYGDEENLRIVDTAKADNHDLHLRSTPEMQKNVITMIPNGSIVHIIGETLESDGRQWTEIEYKDKDSGVMLKGWVAKEYLSEYVSQQEKVLENITINNSGTVTGIDVSSMSPEALRKLLQSQIPENINTPYQNINTTQVAGKINFVYIKLGASPYGNGEFKPLDYDDYKEQVKVCEELGVPYGFYYYSTARTIEEAQIEAQHIEHVVKGLGDVQHNSLPFAIDVELAGKNDRQYGHNVTQSKAHLINLLSEKGITEETLLYCPGRVLDHKLAEQVIDMEDFKTELSNPDKVSVWLCAPTNQRGETTQSTKDYIQLINQHGFDVAMCQVLLDGEVNGARLDVNAMTTQAMGKYLQGTLNIKTNNDLVDLIVAAQEDESR